MSPSLNRFRTLVLACALAATPALAVVTSSCPAPCARPPKYALFMRDTNKLDANSYTVPLAGTMSRGTAHTVLRVDATAAVMGSGSILSLQLYPIVNGQYQDSSFVGDVNACAQTHPFCSITGTFWFDIDELEAANPGSFVGQPLNISVQAGAQTGSDPGASYHLTFSAQVVKKK